MQHTPRLNWKYEEEERNHGHKKEPDVPDTVPSGQLMPSYNYVYIKK